MRSKGAFWLQVLMKGKVSDDTLCHLVLTLDAWQGCRKEGSQEESYHKMQFVGMIRALHLEGKISNRELWDIMDEVAEIVGMMASTPT